VKVASLNVCGLLSKIICPEFVNFVKRHDIVGLQEVKTDEFDVLSVEIPGYVYVQKCRKKYKSKSGGVGVYVKDSLIHNVEFLKTECDNCVMFNLKGGTKSIVFVVCYVEPENSDYYDIECFENIQSELCKYADESSVILMGDLNGRTGKLDDQLHVDDNVLEQCGIDENLLDQLFNISNLSDVVIPHRVSADANVNNNGRKIIELCKNNKMVILNGRMGEDSGCGKVTCKTSNGTSVVDYIITSQCMLSEIVDFDVLEFDDLLSDVHCPVFVKLKLCNKVMRTTDEEKNTDTASAKRFLRPRWKADYRTPFIQAIDTDKVRECEARLTDMLQSGNFVSENVNEINNMVCDILRNSAKSCGAINEKHKRALPSAGNSGNRNRSAEDHAWYNNECEKKRKDLYKARNKFKRNKTEENKKSKTEASKEYKKVLRKQHVAYKRDMVKKLRNLKSSDPKKYWSMICDKGRNNQNAVNIHMDVLKNHFRDLSNKEDVVDGSESVEELNDTDNEQLNVPFTKDEILDAIKKLKSNKASGMDLILNEFLNNSALIMVDIWVLLFNVVMESGMVPESWSIGIIKPLYKGKGDKGNIDNYRGITLLSCVGKLFTSCLNSRINCFLDDNDLLGEEQIGFRKGYSTVDHIFAMHAVVEMYKAMHKRIYCAFVDFRKAFDGIHRSILWRKLLDYHISGKILNVIRNLYSNAKSCVSTKNEYSQFFTSNIGVKQGENLSPVLFALFLNDLQDHLTHSFNGLGDLNDTVLNGIEVFLKLYILLYADDTAIIAENERELQLALDSMHEYCVVNKLRVNASKTKIVIFSRGKVRNYPVFKFGDDVLDVTDSYPYLGIELNYNGRLQKAQKKLFEQGQKAMFSLLSKCKKLHLPLDICMELFDQLVLPILLYGAEVWGTQSCNLVDKLRLKFVKVLTRCRMSTSTNIILGEMGRLPGEFYAKCRVLTYWCKINVQKKDICLAKLIYDVMYKLHVEGTYRFDWLEKVELWLNECGFSNIWEQQGAPVLWFKHAIKTRLSDVYMQQFFENINLSESCYNYRLYKCEWGTEQYLKVLPPQSAMLFFKFRSGNCGLPVNRLRFDGVDRESRICHICGDDVGDEYHYIMNCNHFSSDRATYVKRYYRVRPNTIKFKSLMCSVDSKELLNLCTFIRKIVKEVKSFTY